MRQVENLLRGTVTLTARGPFPERLLNLCAQEQVPCWGLEWVGRARAALITLRQKLRRLEELAQRVGCEIEVEGSRGTARLPAALSQALCLSGWPCPECGGGVFSFPVYSHHQVTGNEQVSTASILSQLRQQGVRPGVYGPGLDRKAIAQRACWNCLTCPGCPSISTAPSWRWWCGRR